MLTLDFLEFVVYIYVCCSQIIENYRVLLSNLIRVILSTTKNYYYVLPSITENYKFSKKFDKSATECY